MLSAVEYDIPEAPWSEAERETWATAERLLPSAWAEEHRVLPAGQSARPGPWRNRNAPYLVGIMDACVRPGVRRVSIKKAAQVGVSEAIRNVIAEAACSDPDPAMLNLPTESKGREIFSERLLPMFEATPALQALHTGLARDAKCTQIRLLNGFVLWLGWSGSATSLASHPVRRVINDEVNKFAMMAGNEADPMALAHQRQKTYEDKALTVDVSSPTYREVGISRLVAEADIELHYWVFCPRCRRPMELTWDCVRYAKWDGIEPREHARRIQREQAAWYECPHCGGKFGEREKPGLVRRGFWASVDQIDRRDYLGQDTPMGAILEKGLWPAVSTQRSAVSGQPEAESRKLKAESGPRHVGFVIESMPALWVRCWDLAAKWVRCQHDPLLLMDVVNGDFGRDFERQISSNKLDVFEAKSKGATWPPLVLPDWTGRLLMTADIQGDHAWCVIRAWGAGLRSRRIWHGCVPWKKNDPAGGAEIRRRAFETVYPFEGSQTRRGMSCDALGIDTGGDRTEEMYAFARGDSRIYPLKGASWPQLRLVEPRRTSFNPPGERDPFAMFLYLVDGDRLNDWLAAAVATRIRVGEAEVDQWELNSENDPQYNHQLASEHKVMIRKPGKGLVEAWVKREGTAANHYRDCERYQRAMAFIFGVEQLGDTPAEASAPEPLAPALTTPDGRPWFLGDR